MSDDDKTGGDDVEVIQGRRGRTPGARATAPGVEAATRPGKKQARVWIKIPKTKEDVRDVFVAHNFVGYRVKRGVEVEVPEGVVHALEIAIGTTLVPEEDPTTRHVVMTPQETQSYPFQVLRRSADEAVA